MMLSLVVPVLNEEEAVPVFLAAIAPVLEPYPDHEIIFVDDGSTDRTVERIREARAKDERIKYVSFSRNFGKENAMTAGFCHAAGDAVIPIDVDLQDPPETIHEMVRLWREEGYEMVVGVRSDRRSDSFLKRFTSHQFYKVMSRLASEPIIEHAGDFRLLDRRVVDALNRMPERNRFMKGMYAWPGFRVTTVPFVRQPRAAGKTKWKYLSLWSFAVNGIISFSTKPLKIWAYVGLVVSAFAFAYMIFTIAKTLLFGIDTPGYASLLSIILFFNGLTLIGIGILGEYLARVFEEVKRRPLYIIRDAEGLDVE